jgi:hypothetical protein
MVALLLHLLRLSPSSAAATASSSWRTSRCANNSPCKRERRPGPGFAGLIASLGLAGRGLGRLEAAPPDREPQRRPAMAAPPLPRVRVLDQTLRSPPEPRPGRCPLVPLRRDRRRDGEQMAADQPLRPGFRRTSSPSATRRPTTKAMTLESGYAVTDAEPRGLLAGMLPGGAPFRIVPLGPRPAGQRPES